MSRGRAPVLHLAVAALLAALAPILLDLSGGIEAFNRLLYDAYLRNRNQEESAGSVSQHIALVTVTNADVQALNRPFPWPRDEQSVIFEKVAALEPSVVAIDLLYPEASDPAADGRLGFQLAACEKVAAAFYFDESEQRQAVESTLLEESGDRMGAEFEKGAWMVFRHAPSLPTEAIGAGMTRLGHVHAHPDSDGVIRRLQMVIHYQNQLYPSLALQTMLLHWKLDWSQLSLSANELKLVGVPDKGTVRIPLDREGCMLLNYRGSLESRFSNVNVFSLMEKSQPALRNKIIIVGSLVTGHGDIYATPIDPSTPGILINAQAMDQIESGDFLREVAPILRWSMIGLSAFLSAFICWLVRPMMGAGMLIVILASLGWGCFMLLSEYGVWLPPAGGFFASFLATGLMSICHFQAVTKKHRQVVRVFSRYMGPNIGKMLSENPEAFDKGPQREMVTIFFSDIVSYTEISEKLESEELIDMLNRYFDCMAMVAFEHCATVSKYMGDGMMVFFNQPIAQEDHAQRAIRMAIKMQQDLIALNQEFQQEGLPTFAVRMGINTGYAHVGNVGSAGFTDFTLIGPPVNLAARVMDLAGPNEIMISSRTHVLTDEDFTVEDIGEHELKGVSDKQRIFRVITCQ